MSIPMGRRSSARRLLGGTVALAMVAAACGVPAVPSQADRGEEPPGLAESRGPIDIQGHRGARGLRPENTLPSFETALDLGVTTLELDLHFTADGEVVIWHDPQINPEKCRLDSGSPGDLPDPDDESVPAEELMVRALTATQLAGYQCDRNPDPERLPDQSAEPTALAADEYGIVTLGDLFAFVSRYADSDLKTETQRRGARSVMFNIETKRRPGRPGNINDGFDGVNAGAFELELLRVVAAHGVEDRVIIQSFDHRSLWAVRAAAPSIPLAALSVESADPQDLAANGASIWSPNQDLVTGRTIGAAHDAGLAVIPWTVNDPEDMRRLVDMGVDGLITDRPDIAMALFPGR